MATRRKSHLWNDEYREMKLLSGYGTSWKVVLLLSIMLPVGLFTGLKLTGIAPTPKPETVTLAPVVWQFNRPSVLTETNQTLNATYADDAGKMDFSVSTGLYSPPDIAIRIYTLSVRISLVAMPVKGVFSIRSILVTFGKDPQPSAISVQLWNLENLSLAGYSEGEQANIRLLGNDCSVGVHCWFLVIWDLFTPNNITNSREVTFEVTYFNGTAYKRIVQPFELTLRGG